MEGAAADRPAPFRNLVKSGTAAQVALRKVAAGRQLSADPLGRAAEVCLNGELGVLDSSAPSVHAEYARYIDGDLLGKILTKSFLQNRVGVLADRITIPIGRYGDAAAKYGERGVVQHDVGDGHVETDQGRVTFEIKCARINIANRFRGGQSENWAFVNLLHSPGKAPKSYDILVAIGVLALGLEDDRYWDHLRSTHDELLSQGHESAIDALPHEPPFLSRCAFFVLPRASVKTNFVRLSVGSLPKSKYVTYLAWGHDEARCRTVWQGALSAQVG